MSAGRLYLDTSALVKLVRHEPETQALVEVILASGVTPAASALARVELRRAVTAAGGDTDSRRQAEAILRDLDLIAVDEGVLDDAGALPTPGLRSLDAIHVASAALLGDDLAAVVTYDGRMLAAAEAAGLPAVSPGA